MATRRLGSVLLTIAVVTGAWLGAAAPAPASLANLLPGLFDADIFLAPPGGNFPSHETHFVDEGSVLRATSARLNESLAIQLATFPFASSAGGFTYTFDEELGVFTRSTDSFGPLYTERAQTLGKGKWNVGFTYFQTSYDELDDVELGNGSIEFQLLHVDLPPTGTRQDRFFEGDLINARLFVDVESSTAVFFANYGVSDRFDLAVAIPVQDVELSAQAVLTVDRLSTSNNTGIHVFPDGSDELRIQASDSASGVGDVLLRGKYRLSGEGESGFALAFDLRLPTGDENDLLGLGVTQGKLLLAGSTAWGPVSPHVNLGYTASEGDSNVLGEIPDEINYGLGFDLAAHPRLTLSAELVGRTLQDATTFERRQQTFQFTRQDGSSSSAERPVVRLQRDDVNVLLAAAGLKWNVHQNLLLSADALFDIGDGLVDDGLILVLGLDYSF